MLCKRLSWKILILLSGIVFELLVYSFNFAEITPRFFSEGAEPTAEDWLDFLLVGNIRVLAAEILKKKQPKLKRARQYWGFLLNSGLKQVQLRVTLFWRKSRHWIVSMVTFLLNTLELSFGVRLNSCPLRHHFQGLEEHCEAFVVDLVGCGAPLTFKACGFWWTRFWRMSTLKSIEAEPLGYGWG